MPGERGRGGSWSDRGWVGGLWISDRRRERMGVVQELPARGGRGGRERGKGRAAGPPRPPASR